MENITREREATLRGLLKVQFGIADEANPLAAAAKVAGYADEYDMALRAIMGKPAESAKKKAPKGIKGKETPEDAKVPDDELLLLLGAMCEEDPEGVRGPDWYRKLTEQGVVTMTKEGFYARLAKLVADGKILSEKVERDAVIYGRPTVTNVTLYTLVEGSDQ